MVCKELKNTVIASWLVFNVGFLWWWWGYVSVLCCYCCSQPNHFLQRLNKVSCILFQRFSSSSSSSLQPEKGGEQITSFLPNGLMSREDLDTKIATTFFTVTLRQTEKVHKYQEVSKDRTTLMPQTENMDFFPCSVSTMTSRTNQKTNENDCMKYMHFQQVWRKTKATRTTILQV